MSTLLDAVNPVVVQPRSNRSWRVWAFARAQFQLEVVLEGTSTYYVYDVINGVRADRWSELSKGEGIFNRFEHALGFCRSMLEQAMEGAA